MLTKSTDRLKALWLQNSEAVLLYVHADSVFVRTVSSSIVALDQKLACPFLLIFPCFHSNALDPQSASRYSLLSKRFG